MYYPLEAKSSQVDVNLGQNRTCESITCYVTAGTDLPITVLIDFILMFKVL